VSCTRNVSPCAKQCDKSLGLVLDPLILCSKHTPQWSSPAIFIFQYLWPLQVGARRDAKGESEPAVSEHLSTLAASLGTFVPRFASVPL